MSEKQPSFVVHVSPEGNHWRWWLPLTRFTGTTPKRDDIADAVIETLNAEGWRTYDSDGSSEGYVALYDSPSEKLVNLDEPLATLKALQTERLNLLRRLEQISKEEEETASPIAWEMRLMGLGNDAIQKLLGVLPKEDYMQMRKRINGV